MATFNDSKLSWYENDGTGVFAPAKLISGAARFPQFIFIADMDGDNDQDVLSASQGDNKLAWYENIGCAATTDHVFVNAAATGGNTGASWADAFTSIQAAINYAAKCANVKQIWVARGTYRPSLGTDRERTFRLVGDLALYGGFAGTESALSERNPLVNETALSGDLGVAGNRNDNAFHIITVTDPLSKIRVDGFRISFGNANGTGNQANGGAIWIENTAPIIANCRFEDNTATGDGGAIAVAGTAAPFIQQSTFINNSSTANGGAIGLLGGGYRLVQSTFINNRALNGAAVVMGVGSYANLTFQGNQATEKGGAIWLQGGAVLLANVAFVGNRAQEGGGFFGQGVSVNIAHGTFAANEALTGPAFSLASGAATLSNSIVWQHALPAFNGTVAISSSIVQGGFAGTDNLDQDPLFVQNPNLGANSFGNVQIQETSPAANSGDDALIPNDVADANLNNNVAEKLSIDLAGKARVIGSKVDRGAFEFTNNTPPTDITLDPFTIEEGLPIGTLIGKLTAADPDPDEAFTFRFVDGDGSAGNMSFTLNNDAISSAEIFDFEEQNVYNIRIEVRDKAGNTFQKSLQVQIIDIDEDPAFTPAADLVTSLEDGGAFNFSGWATDITDGDANEGAQTLTFIISNVSNPDLFSVQPAVSGNGTLTFTSAPDAFGDATMTISLSDGNNTTPPVQLRIAVLPVNDQPTLEAEDPPASVKNGGLQTVANWATFNPGPANESTQLPDYELISVSDPTFFEVLPYRFG